MIVNIPTVLLAERALKWIPVKFVRMVAALIYAFPCRCSPIGCSVGKNQPYLRLPRLFVRETFDLNGEREAVFRHEHDRVGRLASVA